MESKIIDVLKIWAQSFATANPSRKYRKAREVKLYMECLALGLVVDIPDAVAENIRLYHK